METEKELKKKMNKIKRTHEKNKQLYERKFMFLILKELIRNDEIFGELCKDESDNKTNIIE